MNHFVFEVVNPGVDINILDYLEEEACQSGTPGHEIQTPKIGAQ